MDNEIDTIKDLFQDHDVLMDTKLDNESYELECRIHGYFVSKTSLNKILNIMEASDTKINVLHYNEAKIKDKDRLTSYRKRVYEGGGERIECKSRLEIIGLKNIWTDIILSSEVTLTEDKYNDMFCDCTYTNIVRCTFDL